MNPNHDAPPTGTAPQDEAVTDGLTDEAAETEELLVEEISIDGMCGVY